MRPRDDPKIREFMKWTLLWEHASNIKNRKLWLKCEKAINHPENRINAMWSNLPEWYRKQIHNPENDWAMATWFKNRIHEREPKK